MHTQKFKEGLKVSLVNAYEPCLQVLPEEVSGQLVYAFTVFVTQALGVLG